MDDYKYSIWLEVRRLIESGEESWICIALSKATYGKFKVDYWIDELFLEFTSLFDDEIWFKSGRCDVAYSAWFEYNWKEPRLRVIDMLLNRYN